jgi:hypothetical protein
VLGIALGVLALRFARGVWSTRHPAAVSPAATLSTLKCLPDVLLVPPPHLFELLHDTLSPLTTLQLGSSRYRFPTLVEVSFCRAFPAMLLRERSVAGSVFSMVEVFIAVGRGQVVAAGGFFTVNAAMTYLVLDPRSLSPLFRPA